MRGDAVETGLLETLRRPGLERDAVFLLCSRLIEERVPGCRVVFTGRLRSGSSGRTGGRAR